MSNETPPLPVNIYTPPTGGNGVEVAEAHFFRTQFNTNIVLTIPAGTLSGGVYLSDSITILPPSLNSFASSNSVTFTTSTATVLETVNIAYTVLISYKLNTALNTNYVNARELRCYPARPNGTIYNTSVGSNNQPLPSAIDKIQLNGVISHTAGDVVTLFFQLAQTQTNSSDSQVTIFRIDWQMLTIL